jgi:catechol 2,3-dioxygenase-like lactoylglutathione lyase family enzyme
MLDHAVLRVRDYERAKAFYHAALLPLGYTLLTEHGADQAGVRTCGFGVEKKPAFWIAEGKPTTSQGDVHFAFVAADRAAVDAFYRAAIAAGARDNGAPGPRPYYHRDYYGAFVFDLDGNNIEAVVHRPAG